MNFRQIFACALLLQAWMSTGYALAGELKEPGLAFPSTFSESGRLSLHAALKGNAFQYSGGHFVNSATTLTYRGDTSGLNAFLAGIAKCPGFTLSVRFDSSDYPGTTGTDWVLSHNAHSPDQVFVRINLKSSKLKLEELTIPPSGAPRP